MNISVSELNCFLTCEFDWWCRYVARRIPRRPEPALAAGTFWHSLMADFIRSGDKGKSLSHAMERMDDLREEMIAMSATDDILKDFETQCARLLAAFSSYRDFVASEETLLIEEPLSAPLLGTPHTLVGTPDRVIRLKGDSSIWHVQYKTISDRTPVWVFLASQERSLHELVYSHLICTHLGIPASNYGGTILNVVRKISAKAMREHPDSAFVQEFVPIRQSEVAHALSDIQQLARRMDDIRSGVRAPIHNRLADVGRFGNTLSPYWDVRRGLGDISNDALYMDAPDRYPAQEPL